MGSTQESHSILGDWSMGEEIGIPSVEVKFVDIRRNTKGQAVVGAFLCQDFGAFGGGAGKFQGSFDRFRSRVAEEAGIARGTQFFDEGFGEEAGEDGAVHLDHVGEVEI